MAKLNDDQLDNLFRKSVDDLTDYVFWSLQEPWHIMKIQLDIVKPNDGPLP